MKRYISTYFYSDDIDKGASYGNIFLPLTERNKIYWQTVYTFFFSSIVCNKNSGFCYALFTNVKSFPMRDQIEALGVKVYDDLSLTVRNHGLWATVKFFFDVIEYIERHDNFDINDDFVLLDTDVVSMSGAEPLFERLNQLDSPIAYIFSEIEDKVEDFHGVSISSLEEVGASMFGNHRKIQDLIGGEFFCFKKRQVNTFLNFFKLFNHTGYSGTLTTEEQILTLVHVHRPWNVFSGAIFRVWTTLRVFRIPKKDSSYIFLHLPSEKESGLNKLFYEAEKANPYKMTEIEFHQLFDRCIPLNKPYKLYLSKLLIKVHRLIF